MIEAYSLFVKTVNTTFQLQNNPTAEKIVEILKSTLEESPKLFYDHIDNFIQITQNYLLEMNDKQKCLFVDLITQCLSEYPSFQKKNPSKILRVFDMICRVVVNISETVSEIWFNPPAWFDEKDLQKLEQLDKDTYISQCIIKNVNQLAKIVGYSKMLKIVDQKVLNYYKNGDWRLKFGVLMSVAQLSSSRLQIQQIGTVLALIKFGIYDEHPKVRYAAIQALGQYSDDMKPYFQQKHFKQFMQVIVAGIDDKVERVAAHWLACLTNFIEQYNETLQFLPFAERIFNKICFFIQNGNVISKENSLSALSSIVMMPLLFDTKTIMKPFEISHAVFQFPSAKMFVGFLNGALQSMTMTILFQPNYLVKGFYQLANEMIYQWSSQINAKNLVNQWYRICVPQFRFDNWKQTFEKVKNVYYNFPRQNVDIWFDSVIATVKCFKEQFYSFAIHMIDFIIMQLEKLPKKIIPGAQETIKQILLKSKPLNPDQTWNFKVKHSINYFFSRIDQYIEKDHFNSARGLTQAIKELIVNYNYLYTETQLKEYYNQLQEYLQKLEDLIDDLGNKLEQLNRQDEQDESVSFDIQYQDSNIWSIICSMNKCKIQLKSLMWIIQKKVANSSKQIQQFYKNPILTLQYLFKEQLYKGVAGNLETFSHFIQELGYPQLQKYWQLIFFYIQDCIQKFDCEQKQSAFITYNKIIEKSPIQIVNQKKIMTWIKDIQNSYKTPLKPEDNENSYKLCRDKCILTIGTILKKFSTFYDLKFLLKTWVQTLPLNYYSDENKAQYSYICDLIMKQPQLIVDEKNLNQGLDTLKYVIKSLGKYLIKLIAAKYKQQNKEILTMIKSALSQVFSWPIYQQNQSNLTKDLTGTERLAIETLISNQVTNFI